jgi:hypothetical protein
MDKFKEKMMDKFKESVEGDNVTVTLHRGRYWIGTKNAFFLGLTEKKVKVRMGRKVKYYNPENVRLGSKKWKY